MNDFFNGVQWHTEPREDGSLRLHYDGRNAMYECKASAFDNENDDEGLFLFDCFCPLIVPGELRPRMLEFCSLVNQRSIYGWMACDEAGVLRTRSSFYVNRWFKPQPAMIGPVVQFTVNVMDDYLPAVASVIAGELSEHEAFERAMSDSVD